MFKTILKSITAVYLLSLLSSANAQGVDGFLACADIEDRFERVFCLEDALEEAVEIREQVGQQGLIQQTQQVERAQTIQGGEVESFGLETATVESENQPTATAVPTVEKKSGFRIPVIGNVFRRNRDDEAQEVAMEVENTSESSDRVDNFGTEPRVITYEDGREELTDVVSELEEGMPNMWLIRLSSGQVWRQTHPRRYNLREDDEVRIYPSVWGESYRLETDRLSGFIQVLRVQ